ncbi:MAG: hypothetical protein LBN39_10590 [Planctomycetaceae bacterium]|jgi:hypothetical protein|nr:hypothetical protein [Planctomycetaceae bacterium]
MQSETSENKKVDMFYRFAWDSEQTDEQMFQLAEEVAEKVREQSQQIAACAFSVLFESELLGYAALVLFVLSNLSGYAVLPFLHRKQEFAFYLIAQSLSLCSFFSSSWIAISISAAC